MSKMRLEFEEVRSEIICAESVSDKEMKIKIEVRFLLPKASKKIRNNFIRIK